MRKWKGKKTIEQSMDTSIYDLPLGVSKARACGKRG